ncbi:MAG: membrane protein insertion efficiency factor YidD [Acidobacteria bacterium]|nr:membrane protein insertion efficiency factor YidD [Acidobacteriota bacterium]MBV9145782.1 membrane protein insertion efficiency factor YidD [Acidobacteriota bacterium]
MQFLFGEIASRQSIVEMLLLFYKRWISPVFGNACRFSPTCAEYAAQAVVERGWVRGGAMAARRLLRCHPFGGFGFDPVPHCSHVEQLRP